MEQQVTRVPQHTTSPVTSQLIERLKNGKAGDEVSYDELSRLVGKNVACGGDGYHNLRTARRQVRRLNGIQWDPIRDGRLRCMTSGEMHDDGKRRIGRLRRVARENIERRSCIDESQLTPEQLAEHRAEKLQNSTVMLMTQPQTRKRLVQKQSAVVPDRDKMIELFG